MNIKIHVIKQLVEIDLKFNIAKKEMKSKNYHKVAEILCDIKKLTQSTEGKDESEPELVKAMKKEAIFISENFLFDVSNLWRETVVCEKVDDDSAVMFVIRVEVSSASSFAQLVQALHLYDELSLKTQVLSDRLLENIVITLMTQSCSIDVSASEVRSALKVTVVAATRPDPSTVISKLKEMFRYLDHSLGVKVTSTLTLVNLLGQKMANEFCDMFIKQILSDAIPSNNKEREAYEKVVQETLDLQEFLESIGDKNTIILLHSNNIFFLDHISGKG